MLKKSHRFHGYGSVRGVYAKGETLRGGVISLKYAQRSADKPYRVAVVVSRKVHKSAVQRNRIRRRVFEAVRTTSAQLPAATDLVFTVFDERVADLPTKELQQLVTGLIQRANSGQS